jgi:hypothetical protein
LSLPESTPRRRGPTSRGSSRAGLAFRPPELSQPWLSWLYLQESGLDPPAIAGAASHLAAAIIGEPGLAVSMTRAKLAPLVLRNLGRASRSPNSQPQINGELRFPQQCPQSQIQTITLYPLKLRLKLRRRQDHILQ